ncbi:hypothetical protein VTP01DRAFT_10218 [Rhizomucor pusillus]|uniref:uncharacterized protein n=1 Tax=Rhizomucor pusillus TaxID=4840 RepID=UPI003743EB10
MSTKIHDEISERNAELLNDVAYVDYAIGGLNPRFSWADVSTAFCDSMPFWCLTCASLMRKPEEIGRFISLIRARFAMVADELPRVIIKCVYSGLCGERLTVFPTEKLQRALRELGITAKDFKGAYIAIKVSFQQGIPLHTVIRCVRQAVRLLEESTVILHDIDIAVYCAFISTRAIIKEYLMTLGVTDRDIADDVKDMLESTDVRSKVGSQPANLIMNPCPRLTEKLKSFMASGMSRIEITFYSSTIYIVEEYRLILDQTLERLSQCPTFEISFERQWRALANEISSFSAIYVQDKGIFGYSHWWNSTTRKKQGVCRSRVDGKDLIQLLSNFSFNDRPIHCLILETARDEDQSHSPYHLVQYRGNVRTRFATTLVPAQNDPLYPFRSSLPGVPFFASIGLVEANGVLIDWPLDRLRKATKDREASTVCSIQLYEENIRSMPSGDHVRVDDSRLVEMRNLLRPTDYKADYNVLVLGSSYTITHFGTTMYKGRLYICLQSDDEIGFQCSSQRLASVVEEYIQRGEIFTIHVDGIVKRRGFKEINARIE